MNKKEFRKIHPYNNALAKDRFKLLQGFIDDLEGALLNADKDYALVAYEGIQDKARDVRSAILDREPPKRTLNHE